MEFKAKGTTFCFQSKSHQRTTWIFVQKLQAKTTSAAAEKVTDSNIKKID